MDILFINIPLVFLFISIFFIKRNKSCEILINFLISFIINLLIAIFFKIKYIDAIIIGFYNVINVILCYYKSKKWLNYLPLCLILIEMFAFNSKYILNDNFIFNYSGFIILNLFVIFLLLLYKDREIDFNRININKVFKVTMLACLFAMVIFLVYSFFNSERYYISYPLDYEKFNYKKNPYALLFEGFMNKHLYLNIKPDPRIGMLDNPYVGFSRYEHLWDFAWYDNKYYVYFGVAPVILFYYPIYLLSFGNYIPAYSFINVILLIFTTAFAFLTLLRFYKHFAKKFSLVIFTLCLIASFLGGGYLFLALAEEMYNTPILSGVCFMFIMYYFAIKGIEEDSKISFLIMGIAFILILSSRPNLTLSLFLLLPSLIKYLFKNKVFLPNLLKFVPCFIALFIGFTLIGSYNYLRFKSVFDFGSNYQLTVSDVSKNKLTFENTWAALYYYLLQLPRFENNAPFLKIQALNIKTFNLSHYVYVFPTIGLLTIPLNLFIIVGFIKNKNKELLLFNIVAIIFILVLSFVNFSIAGVHIRYLMDLLPICLFVSLLNILLFNDRINSIKGKYIFKSVFYIAFSISIFYYLNILVNESYIIIKEYPLIKQSIYKILNGIMHKQ